MIWLGGGVALTTAGTIKVTDPTFILWGNLDSAFAANAIADYPLNDLVTLRAMPRYIMNIKLSGDPDSTAKSGVDLRFGGTIGKQVAPRLRLYGLGALGYASFSGWGPSSTDRNSGMTLSFGAGGAYVINPTRRLYLEAVYELGFEQDNGDDVRLNWLELSAGLQFGLAH
ncbi:MAG TPA: hypothetical protein VMJ10_18780 [Kofleriaceae bacterium]|nr:hypothetical protein [Kofleriaceae bacterium]